MADRLIEHTVSEHTRVEGVGRVRYVRSPDHEHWHFLGFMRYELRHAGKRAALARDRKTGFCLGDRYQASGAHLPAQPAAPVYTGRCGLGQTGRLHLVEGISVGYGDDYPAALEGQSLRLTGLPAGRYVLLHRVNVERRLRESSYRNNASSLLLGLRWRHAKPRLRVLASCPNSARCNDPQRRRRLGAAVEACRPAPPTEEARAMTDAPTTTGSTRRRTKVRRLQPQQPERASRRRARRDARRPGAPRGRDLAQGRLLAGRIKSSSGGQPKPRFGPRAGWADRRSSAPLLKAAKTRPLAQDPVRTPSSVTTAGRPEQASAEGCRDARSSPKR